MSSTATPRAFSDSTRSRTSTRPSGSSALVGSSRTTSSGRATRATARPEPLLHALGEAADPVAGAVGQADQGQALAPLAGRHVDAGQPDVQVEHLGGGQPRLVAEQLGQVADARRGPRVGRRPAEQQHLAGVGPDQARAAS